MTLSKHIEYVGTRFYRVGGVELMLVPLLKEAASYTRSAGDGYFMVTLMGEPGTAYPLNLRAAASYDPDYLGKKLKLDRRGYGYTPEELADALREIADDLRAEEALD
jgi:hypothetical protein